MLQAKPFVKWAGGKGKLLKLLEGQLPKDFDLQEDVTYIEPFVGGGAMLFHMLNNHPNIKRVIINDVNKDLIRCYQLIKDNPQALIDDLELLERNYNLMSTESSKKEYYYSIRDAYNNAQLDEDLKAAYLIFLNKTCFNGLYRVNLNGKFNVPYGRERKQQICNKDIIWKDHELLQKVEILCGDYKGVLNEIQDGLSFVYLDPPYRPLMGANSFKKYSEYEFGDDEQVELNVFCDDITKRGCLFMLSNSDSENEDGSSFFKSLYDKYECDIIVAPRFINSFSAKKKKQTEVLIKNYKDTKEPLPIV